MNNFEEYSPFLDLIADSKTNDVNSPVQHEFESYGPFQGDEDEMFYLEDSSEYTESEDFNSVEEQEYEWEDESYTRENSFNNEFNVSSDKGITDYLNVSAVKGHNLKTGVFIPSGYQQSDKADIVVYLHGLYANGDKTNGIEYYWKNYSNIRDYFYSTQRNAILIAPTLSSNPQNGDVIFNTPGGLDKFLIDCLKALQTKGYLSVASDFNNIILAAHSAGGRPLARILGYRGVYNDRIMECWGFDCLYAEWWGQNINQWAQGNKTFYHYWAWSCSAKNLASCPRVVGDKFTGNPNFQNIAPSGKVGHRDVIENAWLYQIINRSWFKKIGSVLMSPDEELNIDGFGTSLYSQEDLENFDEQENLVPDISKAVRLNAYYAGLLGWEKYIDKINDFLLPFSGQTNVSLDPEAFAQALSVWQTQQGFSSRDSDGILGPNTWNMIKSTILSTASVPSSAAPILTSHGTSNFTFSKFSLSSTPIIIKERDDRRKYAEVREAPIVFLKEIVKNAGEDPQQWFNRFTKITFLGRTLKGDQYVQENLALHLKQLERKLAVQYGGSAADPSIAGDNLMLTHEGFSGSRLVSSTATYSYHMFGLAVDMNYNGCPFIQAHEAFNTWMVKVVNLVANTRVQGIDWGLGTDSTLAQYLKLYDNYAVLNNYLKTYFSLLDVQNESMLSVLLSQCNFKPWNSFSTSDAKAIIQKDLTDIAKAWKGDRSDPEAIFKNGFLGVSRKFVEAMVESGLDWGGRYGDIMHFDMRTTPGVGARIESAKRKYMRDTEFWSSKLYRQTEHERLSNSDYESGYGEDFVSDIPKAIRLNAYYSQTLGWNLHQEKINDFLLPFSGQQNVSLGEEDFADAVSTWQKSIGLSPKECDGIIGPDTWKRMKSLLILGTNYLPVAPLTITTQSAAVALPLQSSLGKLTIDTSIPILAKCYPEYQFTPSDALWLARFVEGEAGGRDDANNHAVIWAMFNRFGILRHHHPDSWINFGAFLKLYSTTLQPLLNNVGAAERVWNNNRINPEKYPVKSSDETYLGTNIKKVQYTKHIKLQNKGWNEFTSSVQNLIARILSGQIPNPGIGIATDFDSTYIFLKASRRKKGISGEPSHEEWIQYTLTHAQNKNLIWIGEQPNLNQLKNAFFIQKYLKDVPFNSVRIESKNGIEKEEYETEAGDGYNESEFYETIDEHNLSSQQNFELNSEYLTKDWSNAIKLNHTYSQSLGWNQFYDKINDLLLPFSGQQNVSLGEEAFAQAVASWQSQQGFPTNEADGIIGPHTWNKMKSFLNIATQPQPAPPTLLSKTVPSLQNIFDFNRWYAQKILDSINAGIVGVNTHVKYDSKTLLEKITRGEQVIMLNPKTTIIQVLPLMHHICELAGQNNYHEITFGSFIRDAATDGSCTGHCAGRCIDINYKGGSFSSIGSVQMVANILSYLLLLPTQFKKKLGFGLPFQGNFFGQKNLTKFRSTDPGYLIDPQLKQLIPQLGIVFPDNDNHLHIQIKWL